MARVDFYVLSAQGEAAQAHFACRLAEKAYRLQHRVHVHCGDMQAASRFDDQLWTFRDGSFVPHEIVRHDQTPAESPVTIGHGDVSVSNVDLLINLNHSIPTDTSSFTRIAEIVTSDDESRRQSRQRYSQYRELGHEMETHKL